MQKTKSRQTRLPFNQNPSRTKYKLEYEQEASGHNF